MMNDYLLLATQPQRLPHRSRRCGIWVSPWVEEQVVIDTSALREDEHRFAGKDMFPDDCLLVVVSLRESERLRRIAQELPYPTSGPMIASIILDKLCQDDPSLRQRMRWE